MKDFQRAELGRPLLEIQKEINKQKHEAQQGEDGRYKPLGSNGPSGEEGKFK